MTARTPRPPAALSSGALALLGRMRQDPARAWFIQDLWTARNLTGRTWTWFWRSRQLYAQLDECEQHGLIVVRPATAEAFAQRPFGPSPSTWTSSPECGVRLPWPAFVYRLNATEEHGPQHRAARPGSSPSLPHSGGPAHPVR